MVEISGLGRSFGLDKGTRGRGRNQSIGQFIWGIASLRQDTGMGHELSDEKAGRTAANAEVRRRCDLGEAKSVKEAAGKTVS